MRFSSLSRELQELLDHLECELHVLHHRSILDFHLYFVFIGHQMSHALRCNRYLRNQACPFLSSYPSVTLHPPTLGQIDHSASAGIPCSGRSYSEGHHCHQLAHEQLYDPCHSACVHDQPSAYPFLCSHTSNAFRLHGYFLQMPQLLLFSNSLCADAHLAPFSWFAPPIAS